MKGNTMVGNKGFKTAVMDVFDPIADLSLVSIRFPRWQPSYVLPALGRIWWEWQGRGHKPLDKVLVRMARKLGYEVKRNRKTRDTDVIYSISVDRACMNMWITSIIDPASHGCIEGDVYKGRFKLASSKTGDVLRELDDTVAGWYHSRASQCHAVDRMRHAVNIADMASDPRLSSILFDPFRSAGQVTKIEKFKDDGDVLAFTCPSYERWANTTFVVRRKYPECTRRFRLYERSISNGQWRRT